MTFRPTHAPRGRLVRLGVVLDTRNAPARLREIARMCDGAGIDALWVRDHLAHPDGQPRLEGWGALWLASEGSVRARLGAVLDIGSRPPAVLAAMAGTLDAAVGGRIEISLTTGWADREHLSFGFDLPEPEGAARRLERYADIVRTLLAGDQVAVTSSSDVPDAELGVASPQPGGPPLGVEAATPRQIEVAARVADDLLIPASGATDIDATIALARAACDRSGRDPQTLGIALEVPVSIGRTHAEAEARARYEPLFRVTGPPSEVGVFGTLEECQDRVLALAHSGVTDLRLIVPNTDDVHDVIAQLTAIAIGTVDVLLPNAPRSPSPAPPEGWGGRMNPGAAASIAVPERTGQGTTEPSSRQGEQP